MNLMPQDVEESLSVLVTAYIDSRRSPRAVT